MLLSYWIKVAKPEEELTCAQKVLIEVLIRNNFDNIEAKLYQGMSVAEITEAMDVAFATRQQIKSTPLGRVLV